MSQFSDTIRNFNKTLLVQFLLNLVACAGDHKQAVAADAQRTRMMAHFAFCLVQFGNQNPQPQIAAMNAHLRLTFEISPPAFNKKQLQNNIQMALCFNQCR